MDLAIILTKPPYGDMSGEEAVRYAMGARAGGMEVALFLLEGGVLTARRGQRTEGTGVTSLEEQLVDCAEMGVDIYTDSASLLEGHLGEGDLVPGVKVAGSSDMSDLIKEAGKALIF